MNQGKPIIVCFHYNSIPYFQELFCYCGLRNVLIVNYIISVGLGLQRILLLVNCLDLTLLGKWYQWHTQTFLMAGPVNFDSKCKVMWHAS